MHSKGNFQITHALLFLFSIAPTQAATVLTSNEEAFVTTGQRALSTCAAKPKVIPFMAKALSPFVPPPSPKDCVQSPYHSFKGNNLSPTELSRAFSNNDLMSLGDVLVISEKGHPGAMHLFEKGRYWRTVRTATGIDGTDRETHSGGFILHDQEAKHKVVGMTWGGYLYNWRRIGDQAQGIHYYQDGVSHGCTRITSMQAAKDVFEFLGGQKYTKSNSMIITNSITPEMMDAVDSWAFTQPNYAYTKEYLSKDPATVVPSVWPKNMLVRKLATYEERLKKSIPETQKADATEASLTKKIQEMQVAVDRDATALSKANARMTSAVDAISLASEANRAKDLAKAQASYQEASRTYEKILAQNTSAAEKVRTLKIQLNQLKSARASNRKIEAEAKTNATLLESIRRTQRQIELKDLEEKQRIPAETKPSAPKKK